MTESSRPEPATVELALTSDAECIPAVRSSCQELALAIGFDVEQSKMIMLVMDEALSNVIKHGYHGVGGHPITVRMEHVTHECRPGISITVRDRGRQVDPGTIRSRDLDDVRPGGLGVHLMKSVMDVSGSDGDAFNGFQVENHRHLTPRQQTICEAASLRLNGSQNRVRNP